jgi:hypothetical protein
MDEINAYEGAWGEIQVSVLDEDDPFRRCVLLQEGLAYSKRSAELWQECHPEDIGGHVGDREDLHDEQLIVQCVCSEEVLSGRIDHSQCF